MSRFQGVPDTLYIPLVARIYASRRFPEYFYDPKALSLESEIPSDSIQKAAGEYFNLASVARYHNLDAITREFLSRTGGRGNVVNLGCGLDTACDRIGERGAHFYSSDLPEVIATRERVIGTGPNETLIPADLFSLDWADGMDSTLPTLILVSGVFQYFPHAKVTGFVKALKGRFPEGELVFDAADKLGLAVANRFVRKSGNTSAMMHFYVNDAQAFAEETGTVLAECRLFYTDTRKLLRGKVKPGTAFLMWGSDLLGNGKILHLSWRSAHESSGN
ncbi:MAG: class I SAM-dependent methyltransferase [Bacteroidales bacterium]|nr:class I SAM-dependent methyltransferase [Bacteroidales bacterium]